MLRFFLGSTIIMKRLHFWRWTCPLNYIRTSLLSCANNSDSCFKETCKKRNALYNAHFIVTSFPTRPRQQIWLQNMTNKLMNYSFTVIHQHVENIANKSLNFQIYSSKFHSTDPLYKHRTHATTFALRKKNAANKTTMSTAQQWGYKEYGLVLPYASNKRKV